MEVRFNGQRALVTGVGRGIGRELAKRLHASGAHVIGLSRNPDNLKSLTDEVPEIEPLCVDLSDWNATKKALSELDAVDLLVNNAGYGLLGAVGEVTEQDCDRVFGVNVKSVINVTQEVAKKMIAAKKKGSIVNVSSQASMVALQDHLAYCASKGAVDQITRVCALELGPHGIRVNAVNPTVVLTDMGKLGWSDPAKSGPMLQKIPLGKFAEVSDVVDTICYLLSSKADMINGVILPIDGGFTAT